MMMWQSWLDKQHIMCIEFCPQMAILVQYTQCAQVMMLIYSSYYVISIFVNAYRDWAYSFYCSCWWRQSKIARVSDTEEKTNSSSFTRFATDFANRKCVQNCRNRAERFESNWRFAFCKKSRPTKIGTTQQQFYLECYVCKSRTTWRFYVDRHCSCLRRMVHEQSGALQLVEFCFLFWLIDNL